MSTQMEASTLTSTNIQSGPEQKLGNKAADCYFYYYSSCTKGNACPFRHEPAALRNETMCVYWLKGSCNKPHCIYRHMEIKKNRSKIPCFFESQPGGCKKLHCPFFHNNVLDQPREEDVPKKLDLILPVKDSEMDYETEDSEIKKLQESVAAQLKVHRKLSQSQNEGVQSTKEKEIIADSQTPCIVRKSFIVPLQDGESDSESVTVSPIKPSDLNTRHCIVSEEDSEWELKRLREIQEEEGNLLGYIFTSEDDQADECSGSPSLENDSSLIEEVELIEEEVEEEVHEDQNDDHTLIIRKSFLPNSGSRLMNTQGNFVKRVLSSALLNSSKNNSKLSLSGKPAPESREITKKPLFVKDQHPPLHARIGIQDKVSKPSVKERLGKKPEEVILEDSKAHKEDDSVRTRLGLNSDKVRSKFNLSEEKLKSKTSSKDESDTNFTIKSLADIRAEKLQKMQEGSKNSLKPSCDNFPLSALIGSKKDSPKKSSDINRIKIKTLAEIRAEKGKITHKSVSKSHATSKKRTYSPIRFSPSPEKKVKISSSSTNEKDSTSPNESLSQFSPRKLALKKIKVGSKETVKENPSLQAETGSQHRPISTPSSTPKIPNFRSTESSHKLISRNKNMPSKFENAIAEVKNAPARILSNSESNGISEVQERTSAAVQSSRSPQINISSSKNSHHNDNTGNRTLEVCKTHINRLDSLLDEEELLLAEDVSQYDDEEINEEELLL